MEGIALIDKIETKKGTVEFPCMHPKIVPIEQVVANDYNPIRPGRNLAVIVESAAINYRAKKMGYNAAQELYNRVTGSLSTNKEEQKEQ